jgi:hypothetical protein
MEFLGDAEKLSGLSTELLKELFQDQKKLCGKKIFDFLPEYKNKYLEMNGSYIRKDILKSLDAKSLAEGKFIPHPYIPVEIDNYGTIKYLGDILEEKCIKNGDGYPYVNVLYEIEKLRNERKENKKRENKLSTPIVEKAVEYENKKYPINRYGDWPWHPCIQIGVTDNSKIINLYPKDNGYPNVNFGNIFKEKINNGIKFVEIPIHIYRLVAETWLENPDYCKYKTPHHISNNGYDNSIYNLMWVTDVQHKIIENR